MPSLTPLWTILYLRSIILGRFPDIRIQIDWLAAEQFMIKKINDAAFVAGIAGNQTQRLFVEFKRRISDAAASIKVIERVGLMTPENIHLNSFMYEPILDMSDEHLRKLYGDVLLLN